MNQDEVKQLETIHQHICQKCGKGFATTQALTMHHTRMHTRAGLEGARTGGRVRWARVKKTNPSKYPSESPEYKKHYYQRRKQEFFSMGLNARGIPFKNTKMGRAQRKAKGIIIPQHQPDNSGNEIWIMIKSGVIRCPHCDKIVGE